MEIRKVAVHHVVVRVHSVHGVSGHGGVGAVQADANQTRASHHHTRLLAQRAAEKLDVRMLRVEVDFFNVVPGGVTGEIHPEVVWCFPAAPVAAVSDVGKIADFLFAAHPGDEGGIHSRVAEAAG